MDSPHFHAIHLKNPLQTLENSCYSSMKKLLFHCRFPIRPSFLASQHGQPRLVSSFAGDGSLYRRISPLGDPKISVTPVLDQWVHEGRRVTKDQLEAVIKELKICRRFKHALEVSHWMSDKRFFPLTTKDVSARLSLIFRVHGMEQMESYFNHIPTPLKRFEVYISLLNCYRLANAVEKAEEAFQQVKDIVRTPMCYNLLMDIYCKAGNYEKVDALMHEMKERGIGFDQYSLVTHLKAYAATSNIEGMDQVVQSMESNLSLTLDWKAYDCAADEYLKVGQVDKAINMLKKLEKKISHKRWNIAFNHLLKLYARTGKKDELCSMWERYKKRGKIQNNGYRIMISMLLTLNDTEAAEKIYMVWESNKFSYDFRIPNLLINAYCKEGHLKKAESIIDRVMTEGNEPSVDMWFSLASGYLEDGQINEAKEAIKKSVLVCPPGWKPSKEILVNCLEYLEGKGDTNKAEHFIKSLGTEGIFSPSVHDKLLIYIKTHKRE